MNFAGLNKNDIVDGDSGISTSLWFQGCKKKCKGCHNPQTWDVNGGEKIDNDQIVKKLLKSLDENGISRNLSILGGEPFIVENRKDCNYILSKIKEKRPHTKIILWTGFTYEELLDKEYDSDIENILKLIDILVDGPFMIDLRNINLKMRGSLNQRIIHLKNGKIDFIEE